MYSVLMLIFLTSTSTKIQWHIYPLLKKKLFLKLLTMFCWYILPIMVPVYI